MKNRNLRTKADYEKFLLRLEESKSKLSTLIKGSAQYNKLLKKVLSDTIFAKGNSFCLDNDNERNKLTKIIYDLWIDLEAVSKTTFSGEYRS